MKKILIVINHAQVGGVQKSLLELLKALDKQSTYQVDLFCCLHAGAYLEKLPSSIRLLPENPYARIPEESLSVCRGRGRRYWLWRMGATLWSRIFGKGLPARLLCRAIGQIGDDYDVAISFSQPIGGQAFCTLTNEIVLHCCKAPHKVTFLHCDFANYGGNCRYNRSLYKRFDRIAAVSDSVGWRFAQVVPSAAHKVCTVYNVCDMEGIRRLAAEQPVAYTGKTVVTVARLSEEKGLLRCVPLFARLREDGVEVTWHIVGGGPMRGALEAAIKAHGLEDRVILHGEQLNPYRYIRNADYFLLPSYHEAAPIVFDEAAVLGVPVLTTDTLSAKELVAGRNAGTVCRNTDEDIFAMLKAALATAEPADPPAQPDMERCMRQFEACITP